MMSRIFNRKLLPFMMIIALSQLISGCALFNRPTKTPTNQTLPASHNQTLQHWQLKGKLIFKSPAEKFSANLLWQQQGKLSDIRLNTFLGISILKLKQSKHQATLDYDGKHYQASNAQQLLAKHTQLNWPIEQMPQWVKGISNLPEQHVQYNQAQQIKQITLVDKNGTSWQLNYPQYIDIEHRGKQYQLPKQIRLDNQHISITIKVSRWILE